MLETTRGVPLAAITVITAITVTTVRTAIVRVAVPAIVTVVKSRIAESLLVAIVLHRVVIALHVATALRLAMMPRLLTTMPPFLAMIARSLASGHRLTAASHLSETPLVVLNRLIARTLNDVFVTNKRDDCN